MSYCQASHTKFKPIHFTFSLSCCQTSLTKHFKSQNHDRIHKGIYNFYVYILTNKAKTVLYTGVTNNLKRRLEEHNEKLNPKSFTARYNVEFLVYYERFGWIQQAIAREKEIKLLRRDLKMELIREFNPNMEFLNNRFS